MKFVFVKLFGIVLFMVLGNHFLGIYLNSKGSSNPFIYLAFFNLFFLLLFTIIFTFLFKVRIDIKGNFDRKFTLNTSFVLIGLLVLNVVLFLPLNLDSFIEYHQDNPTFDAVLVIAIFILPIFEEFVYRGVFCELLSRKYGVGKTILFSAILFSFAHIHIETGLISSFSGGLFFAFIYMKTRSLYLVVIFHIIINTLHFPIAKIIVYLVEYRELISSYGVICYILSVLLSLSLILFGLNGIKRNGKPT